MFKKDLGLHIDLYELTMAAGYFQNDARMTAGFELICHSMPPARPFLVACGLQQAVDYVLNLRFSSQDVAYLRSLSVFKSVAKDFFDYLKGFKFTGNIWAMPEGEIFFAREPVIHIEAPIIEAQVLETCLLSIFNIESMVATKAARLSLAARCDGRQRHVIDFGARRAHGLEAALLSARAAYIGGAEGTSNVRAGQEFGIPLYGTMAHAWVEAFDREEESFRKFHDVFPDDTVVLIDTYDTLKSVKMITTLDIRERIKGVRLDSGNLSLLSKKVRRILDHAGLKSVKIMASGNLDEHKILKLIRQKSPIDIFGVGTELMVSPDCPVLNLTYKLVQTKDGQGIKFKAKNSPRKQTVPGHKQVFRITDQKGGIKKDVIALSREKPPAGGRSLLRLIVKDGRLVSRLPSMEESRQYLRQRLAPWVSSLQRRPRVLIEYSHKLSQLADRFQRTGR
ncbi:MAG: nicotinate phosphoribosyltransferase [Candidatus Omnitrophica bacterium]|nr:nicotinate phosphoribosyltransferase [Candidatus Omnitrophota bacterium]MDE2008701.1 nicotinate phosphoribosyltransferase [Candidatus Omnitrophota bacterium]MDE2214842.1 nicotinate phosphoribosyltransferase [Candidatus Omnitrophota bacterium]MDE2231962.1 nicotinate phosphoribosyltransferase [Candidatus Omnitrophota bacterium]